MTPAADDPAGPVGRTGFRLGVLALAVLGTLMMLATVLPTGPSRHEPAPAPSPAVTQQTGRGVLDGHSVTEEPAPGQPVFQGPFGP
ncbi:MAG TPA: hypothetical protein VLC50_06455 [Actinomycetes bacterium]|nr:hypothetical protein [Actinomycetes bacterium]